MIIFFAMNLTLNAQEASVNDFELELQKLEKGEWIKEENQIKVIESLNQKEDHLSDEISVNQASIEKNNDRLENSPSVLDSKINSQSLKPRRIRSR